MISILSRCAGIVKKPHDGRMDMPIHGIKVMYFRIDHVHIVMSMNWMNTVHENNHCTARRHSLASCWEAPR